MTTSPIRKHRPAPGAGHRPALDPVEHYVAVSVCIHRSGDRHARLVYSSGVRGQLVTEALAPSSVEPRGSEWKLALVLDTAAGEMAGREAQLELPF